MSLKVFLIFLAKTKHLIMHFYFRLYCRQFNYHTAWSKKLEKAFWLLNSSLKISLKMSNSSLRIIQDQLTMVKTENGKSFGSRVVRTDRSRICTDNLHGRKEGGRNALKCRDENLPLISKQWSVVRSHSAFYVIWWHSKQALSVPACLMQWNIANQVFFKTLWACTHSM